ncbi:hypothetical protein HHI36_024419 [Cryptolaemus montrouzieri]|uniref:Uncharacterized protein n=1 Tax=Cryptolaemus montrouzieri TaxID=559131 RepID=A0ABD2P487_9CUCU
MRVVVSEHENKILTERLEILEKQRKKKNLLVYGLEIPEGSDFISFASSTLPRFLKIEIRADQISNIYQENIFRKARELKNSGIAIAHYLTFNERSDYEILKKYEEAYKGDSKTIYFIRGRFLHMNGTMYSAEELRDLESNEETDRTKVGNNHLGSEQGV